MPILTGSSPNSLTLLRELVVFGLLLHLLAPALHAACLCLQQLQEPVAIPPAGAPRALWGHHTAAPVPALQPGVWRWQGRGVQCWVQTLREGGGAAPRGGAVKDLPRRRRCGVSGGITVVLRALAQGRVYGLAGAVDHDFLLGRLGVGVGVGDDWKVLRVRVGLLLGGHATGATEPVTCDTDTKWWDEEKNRSMVYHW